MKYRLTILAAILYLVMALPTSAQSTSTITPTVSASFVTASDIYVRGGPGSAYLPVGRLVAGDRVVPVNRSASGVWVMIQYSRGFGWIRRDLARWVEDIDALPTLDETDLTPTSLYTETPIAAPTGYQVNAGAEGAFVRFGPGVSYPFLGAIVTGDYVEPVGRNVEGDWLLIRFRDGFGWIARNLVEGSLDLTRLPVLLPDALTPSVTFTASPTERFTATSTPSVTPTASPTLIPTNTALAATTAVPSNTASPSPLPSLTPSMPPTNTPVPSATYTAVPTDTPTPAPTRTPVPSATPSVTPSDTASPTASNTPRRPARQAMPRPSHTPSRRRIHLRRRRTERSGGANRGRQRVRAERRRCRRKPRPVRRLRRRCLHSRQPVRQARYGTPSPTSGDVHRCPDLDRYADRAAVAAPA
ncbi:MAG: SH3 domain-containing protein [Anaerolineae bacterium]